MLDKDLLAIIACPSCVGDLVLEADRSRLICAKCRLVYAIHDGIPVLLKEEAQPLEAHWRPAPGEAR